jgi:hypothetical protein
MCSSFGTKTQMPRYTIIAEHAGGTYVSQFHANSRGAALQMWIDDPRPDSSARYIHKDKQKHRDKLGELLTNSDSSPWELDGCVNVWQSLFRVRKQGGSLHIIRTDEDAEQAAS